MWLWSLGVICRAVLIRDFSEIDQIFKYYTKNHDTII